MKLLKKLRSKIYRKSGNDLVMAYMVYTHYQKTKTPIPSDQIFAVYLASVMAEIRKHIDEKGNIILSNVRYENMKKMPTNFAPKFVINAIWGNFNSYWVDPKTVPTILVAIVRQQIKQQTESENKQEGEPSDEVHMSNEVAENRNGQIDENITESKR